MKAHSPSTSPLRAAAWAAGRGRQRGEGPVDVVREGGGLGRGDA